MKYADVESRPLGTPLYHYTSLEVFQAIVSTKRMRASHIAYMNDGSELEYGLGFLKQYLRQRIDQSAGRTQELAAALMAVVDTQSVTYVPVFVMCFSQAPNLLSQWQMYTPPGRGVCIGFDHVALIQRALRAGWHWVACKYGMPSQMAWVEAIVTRLLREAAEKDTSFSPWDAAIATVTQARGALYSTLASIKHPAFSAEVEWRLVSPPVELRDPRVQFRKGLTTLVPYLEFELYDSECPKVRLAETWIGPTDHTNHTESVISALQWQFQTEPPIVIRNSLIPFRRI